MMTSNNMAIRIERYLDGRMKHFECLRFEVEILLNPELNKMYLEQKLIRKLVKLYHTNKLKKSLDILHNKLMNDPDHPEFRNRINNIF